MRTYALTVLFVLGCSGGNTSDDQTQPLGETSGTPTGATTPGGAGGNATNPSAPSNGTDSSSSTQVPGTPPNPALPGTPDGEGGAGNVPPTPSTPPTSPATPNMPPTGPAPNTPLPSNGGSANEPEPDVTPGGNDGEVNGPGPGNAGMPPVLDPGICDNNMRDGDETAIDCGGSCPPCPGYPSSKPNSDNEDRSGCEANGNGFMCAQSMVFSPSMKQAVYDDWGADDPPFAYGVVGHDPDPGGVDAEGAGYSSTCCQCYQLVFEHPSASNESLPAPKPMIVQAFNTYAGGPTAFDIYMAGGGHGNFNGCTENGNLYSGYPDVGGDWTGGVRATRYGECNTDMGYTEASVSSAQCQDYVKSQCDLLEGSDVVETISEQSCLEANRIEDHYHTNWEVMVKRVECPESLTLVTGCRLGSQGLPQADPAVQTPAQAQQAGFLDGYHTTTMEDCCRPTCAWPTNVTGTTDGYSHFYVCDAEGNER